MIFGLEYPACCIFNKEIYSCGGGNITGGEFIVVDFIQIFSLDTFE